MIEIPGAADMTIREAKRHLAYHLKEGVVCPCCNRNARARVERMDKAKAAVLEAFYRKRGSALKGTNPWLESKSLIGDEIHTGDIAAVNIARGVHGKLVHWRLLDKHPERKAYRITKKGIMFFEGHMAVFECLLVYNNLRVGNLDGKITFEKAIEGGK